MPRKEGVVAVKLEQKGIVPVLSRRIAAAAHHACRHHQRGRHLIMEAARIYRRLKAGKMDHAEGRSLIWSLSQIRPMLEAQQLEAIEQRLNALGDSSAANRTAAP